MKGFFFLHIHWVRDFSYFIEWTWGTINAWIKTQVNSDYKRDGYG